MAAAETAAALKQEHRVQAQQNAEERAIAEIAEKRASENKVCTTKKRLRRLMLRLLLRLLLLRKTVAEEKSALAAYEASRKKKAVDTYG